MRARDMAMVIVSFLTMILGVFVPQWADVLSPFPRLLLMFLLFFGFLSVGVGALVRETVAIPGHVAVLILVRLLILPLLSFGIFRVVMPEFALGAFLLGAAPVGVMAAVFSLMVRADTALILVGNISTSLLLPLVMPPLLYGLDRCLASLHLDGLHLPVGLSLTGMMLSLCVTLMVPFVLACIIRSLAPALARGILAWQYLLVMTCIVISNTAIFSQYGTVLQQSPVLILKGLAAACLLGLIMMGAGLLLPRSMPAHIRLAFFIGFGIMNNVLMLIVSMEFFSVTEAVMAALYLVPSYALLLPYRYLSGRWHIDQTASGAQGVA